MNSAPDQPDADLGRVLPLTSCQAAPAVRIVLCAERQLWVEALAASLTLHGCEVIVETTRTGDAVTACERHDPDVCVLGNWTPDGGGTETVARISSTTGTRVLVVAERSTSDDLDAAVEAGAAAYVVAEQRFADILDAIDQLSAGERPVPAAIASGAIGGTARPQDPERDLLRFLTRREREALRGIAEGQSTKELSRSMHVAYSTARTHVQNVLTKLGVRSRLQAAALVARVGVPVEFDDLDDTASTAVAGGTRNGVCPWEPPGPEAGAVNR